MDTLTPGLVNVGCSSQSKSSAKRATTNSMSVVMRKSPTAQVSWCDAAFTRTCTGSVCVETAKRTVPIMSEFASALMSMVLQCRLPGFSEATHEALATCNVQYEVIEDAGTVHLPVRHDVLYKWAFVENEDPDPASGCPSFTIKGQSTELMVQSPKNPKVWVPEGGAKPIAFSSCGEKAMFEVSVHCPGTLVLQWAFLPLPVRAEVSEALAKRSQTCGTVDMSPSCLRIPGSALGMVKSAPLRPGLTSNTAPDLHLSDCLTWTPADGTVEFSLNHQLYVQVNPALTTCVLAGALGEHRNGVCLLHIGACFLQHLESWAYKVSVF
jgi:hypothetical protein